MSIVIRDIMGIDTLSARQIVEVVKDITGEYINYNMKNKKGIIKQAINILSDFADDDQTTIEEMIEVINNVTDKNVTFCCDIWLSM
jgi:hypothetical protein